MKKLYYCVLLLFIGFNSFAQESEKLQKHPWEEIVEMNAHKYTPVTKWANDINVGLEGLYTKADSLIVIEIVKKLEALTETISIRFSNIEDSNFKMKFLDTLVRSSGNYNSTINASYDSDNGAYIGAELYVYKIDKTDEEVYETLESRIAGVLVGGNFRYPFKNKKRNSIFNPMAAFNNNTVSLNQKDIAVIKEVYRKGFEARLKIAEKQFSHIVENIRNEEISKRKKSIWWVKNPIVILLFPTIFLLLIFVFLIKKINYLLSVRVKKKWLRFGVISFIALFFIDILIVFCVSFYDFLTIPDDYRKVSVIRMDTVLTTTIVLLVSFPLLYLFRFIEFKIQKIQKSILVKTTLIFLSTGFLPFIVFLLIAFTTSSRGLRNDNFYFLSQVFLSLMIIASIRAFIGYFVFKERSLIVENEKKLSNLRELNAKAELKSLQSQINPHFLYNSLNSIASLAPVDAKKTQEMAHSLSDLFKYSINRKGKKMSTVKEEIDMVKTYLNIEKIRFGERLKFIVEVDKTIENYQIPLFLIQPLVENAVKHGISKLAGNGKIVLKIETQENELVITVSDSGLHFPKGLVSGHGLQTVYDLLRLSYEDKASLNWTNLPEKMITITIPKNL